MYVMLVRLAHVVHCWTSMGIVWMLWMWRVQWVVLVVVAVAELVVPVHLVYLVGGIHP